MIKRLPKGILTICRFSNWRASSINIYNYFKTQLYPMMVLSVFDIVIDWWLWVWWE
jgi:hypothetical protein